MNPPAAGNGLRLDHGGGQSGVKMVAVFDVCKTHSVTGILIGWVMVLHGFTWFLYGFVWFYMVFVWFHMVLYVFKWFYGDFGMVVLYGVFFRWQPFRPPPLRGGRGDHLERLGDGRQHGCGFREHRVGCDRSGFLGRKIWVF